MRNPRIRWVHRWIGLTLGVIFVLSGLSGASLFFQPQFFRWAHGDLMPDTLSRQIGSIDRWVDNARRANPQLHGPIAIWTPQVDHNVSDAGMVMFEGLPPGGFGQTGFASVLVDPASGNVLGTVDVDRSPAYAPLFLHGSLWAGDVGRIVLALMATASFIMLTLGLYLWWPARERLLRKLSPRPIGRVLGQAGPLHQWTGIWISLLLLVMTSTGIYMAQPGWIEPVLPTEPAHDMQADSAGCTGPISFDQAIERGRAFAPSGALLALFPQDEALRRWSIEFQTGATSREEVSVVADLQCGSVALESAPRQRSARQSTELWLATLHDGTVFALPGEILITLAGLGPVTLMTSGLLTWLRRRRFSAHPAK